MKNISWLLSVVALLITTGCDLTPEEIKSRGFQSEEQYRVLKGFGATYAAAISNPELITLEEFIACDAKDYDVCQGEMAVFSAIIKSGGSDGVRLTLTNLDCSEHKENPGNIDMDSWGFEPYEFIREHGKESCVTVLVEIEDENSVYPDVDFVALLSKESKEARVARVAAQAEAKKEADRQKVAASKARRKSITDKYGCLPTLIVRYKCEGSRGGVQEQHFCFNIYESTARQKVANMCADRHFEGAGSTIYGVEVTGYTYQ